MTTLRCKPGQMAIIVKSHAGNEGRIVTCLKYIGEVFGVKHTDLWEIDQKINALRFLNGDVTLVKNEDNLCPDSYMMPLPDLNEKTEDEKELTLENT